MKRRSFLSASALAAATGVAGCGKGGPKAAVQPETPLVTTSGLIAGKTLEALRDEYRYWLFEDFFPFLEAHVVDHEYGGFMCNTDRDGTNISTDKRGWYEGRGIWVYSFLYNNLAPDPKNLEIARKSVELITKSDPGRKKLWPENYSREGKPFGDPDMRGYGSLFIAEGLAEYAKAAKDESYFTRAKEIVTDFVEFYDSPDYAPTAARENLGETMPLMPGARVLGVWMVLIHLTTEMLGQKDDPELKTICDRAIEAIRTSHFNPEFDLINELLNHDMTRAPAPVDQLVTAHAIETMWMLMDEAVRRKDKELFYTAAEWFRRHVEVFWDDVYGGVFTTCRNVNENMWATGKALWAQEETLIGSLMVNEHMGEVWAKEWFDKMYAYVLEKYPLKPHGFAIWNLAADRKVTFVEHYNRVGNFHHPRHLMLNILALERMIARNGNISDIFA